MRKKFLLIPLFILGLLVFTQAPRNTEAANTILWNEVDPPATSGTFVSGVSGDINSDGRTDIIMVEYRRNYIEILALDSGYKPISAMRFKTFEQKSYRDSKRRTQTNVEPRELKVADVTNDGRDDLVTVIHDRIIIYPQD